MPRKASAEPAISYRQDKFAFIRDILGGEPHAAQIELLTGIRRQTAIVRGRKFCKSTAME